MKQRNKLKNIRQYKPAESDIRVWGLNKLELFLVILSLDSLYILHGSFKFVTILKTYFAKLCLTHLYLASK